MYADDFKIQVVADYESGQYTVEALRRKYNIGGNSTIAKWVKRFGKEGQAVASVSVDPRQVDQLQQDLLIAQTRIAYLETVIGLAKDAYGIDLKKKFTGKR